LKRVLAFVTTMTTLATVLGSKVTPARLPSPFPSRAISCSTIPPPMSNLSTVARGLVIAVGKWASTSNVEAPAPGLKTR
jgi:hypothetical protein